MISDLHEQRGDEAPSGAPIARSRVSAPAFWIVMMRKNRPGHERHDEAVEQEDDLERLAHLGHAGRLVGGLVAGQRVEVVASGVDRGDHLRGVVPSAGTTPSAFGSGSPRVRGCGRPRRRGRCRR